MTLRPVQAEMRAVEMREERHPGRASQPAEVSVRPGVPPHTYCLSETRLTGPPACVQATVGTVSVHGDSQASPGQNASGGDVRIAAPRPGVAVRGSTSPAGHASCFIPASGRHGKLNNIEHPAGIVVTRILKNPAGPGSPVNMGFHTVRLASNYGYFNVMGCRVGAEES